MNDESKSRHGKYFYHGIRAYLVLILSFSIKTAATPLYPNLLFLTLILMESEKSPINSSSPNTSPTKNSSVTANASPIHPALTVPNITNFIKIKLSIEKDQYITWSELFKIHARVFQVLDHIIPSSSTDTTPSLKVTDPNLWSRLDAVVLQWIYGTISDDLLNTIIERDSTAELAWNKLFDIFYDNKNSRALYLEQEFSRVHMEQFPDASSYCQHLKSLSDQLANVGADVSNDRLVLQLISGLTDAYAAVGSQIRHGNSLPLFHKARSMIILEETAIAQRAKNSAANTTFIASHDDAPSAGNNNNRNSRSNNNHNNNTRGGRNEGRGGRGRGRGRGSGRGGGRTQHRQAQWPSYPYQQQWPSYPYPHPHQQWVGPWQPCATPPCPYPTAGNFHKQPGILGQKPQQAHVAATPTNPASQNASYSYAPTDIQAAMHTFSISPPDDQWYMDTGATSHMTANGGNGDMEVWADV
ncbi:unnamed protein product [Trifolium pratense]|uniref:Uncharacterized protein n=1 Tax=Trifolium pratense TaxID=57577 RepID=A0ACB0KA26_TRIPR|nr:unnamed protein product [Trifolium pratense]